MPCKKRVVEASEIVRLVTAPGTAEKRYLAVLRAFCDESYDGQERIYTVAGFVSRDDEWDDLSKRFRTRCLEDKIGCYHAADCEGRYNKFQQLSKPQIIQLNTDLITEIVNSSIVGFGTSLVLEDYRKVRESNKEAERLLTSSPYLFTMQNFMVNMCGEIRDARPHYEVAFVFDQQEEFSGRAKQLFDEVKRKNPNTAPCMVSLVYVDKRTFVPLQIADKFAYEVMKNMLNLRYDSSRKERIALTRMKEGLVIQTLNYIDEEMLWKLLAAQTPPVLRFSRDANAKGKTA